MSRYSIGIDFGTLSARAVVMDLSDGKVISSAVSEYAHEDLEAEIKSHKQGAHQNRDYISQDEFEEICEQVLSRRSNITD